MKQVYYVLTTYQNYNADVFYSYAEAKACAKNMKAKPLDGEVFILTGSKHATKIAERVTDDTSAGDAK